MMYSLQLHVHVSIYMCNYMQNASPPAPLRYADNLLAEKIKYYVDGDTVGGTFRQLVVAKTSWQYGTYTCK